MSDIDVAFRCGRIAEIEQQGFEANLQRLPASANPHGEDSWEHEAWVNGYLSADRVSTPRYSAHS